MFLHPSYRNNLFSTKCGTCDLDAKVEFRSGTVTFYRNKNGSIYNFCSFECMDKFNRTKICWFCSYHSDLVSCESGFMICTSDTYWKYSCRDKYYIRLKHDLILEDDPLTDDDYDKISESDSLPDEYKEYVVKHDSDNSDNDSDNSDNDSNNSDNDSNNSDSDSDNSNDPNNFDNPDDNPK
ncbi:hypothetical protein [Acanthamoeba castellanii mimivirus]|uniref:Uncharacterized protein R890 n=6 Tax=Mimivirus TaxID=315393 RepID=YR890_MIMIV|nr:hypothetical protein MIMI_gp0955 [Acanthamoeba polyphaga mimivirus]Q5UQY0.1 RecName: Full=Uncharacterized protein R890 [Acanthamoeba polyphaga mimivirus]AEQ61110.1 hypothetical protein [Acanthamoeba castellanii mamavirus]ALR84527.1 hypothetical protein [Niemeyer virus]AMZ03327.1 hypothetical protein [Mimivirus Bombay]EJN40506.1 hypothetical protein lvs_R781 [Acanthamoeba polyphaga lentillevirus]BAV62030.1 hypothetical protein [Acanthamoeba castellanii mimivirus]